MIYVRRTGVQSSGHAFVEGQGGKLAESKLVQMIVKEGRKQEREKGQGEVWRQEEELLKLDGEG